mmetsp:Transcript_117651/g.230847  ORF Transcript_117651/g.230847 Transcript_117651/m.230847 type:complete len:663 (-) Transcript_117651:46-2034(-)
MFTVSVLLCLVLALFLSECFAKRNGREEAICQPFLTSKQTSPLVPTLQRNLTVDEDGEFACELVLQDEELPVQIRVTIHEGLGWLAIRHTQMGISRQRVAAKHFRLLSELIPGSLNFALKAGTFLLDPVVSDPGLAQKYLRSALYGKASEDPARSPELDYIIQNLYIKSLGQTHQFDLAENEMKILLNKYPYDFEAAAMLQSTFNPSESAINSAYKAIMNYASNSYAGFTPIQAISATEIDASGDAGGVPNSATNWQPQVYTRMLSNDEFMGYISRREPFIIRFGSAKNMSATLNWATQSWRGEVGRIYLQQTVGPDEKVLVETRTHKPQDTTDKPGITSASSTDSAIRGESFGFGLNVHRKVMPFSDVLKDDFTNLQGNESIYLNIQLPKQSTFTSDDSVNEIFRTPLHLLKHDVPLPQMLEDVVGNITEINLWMGVARDRDSQSKLHMDATDNLYVVLEGKKHFSIASPAEALKMKTISPTHAVSPDGLSFQFNVRKFAAYARQRIHNEGANVVHAAKNRTIGKADSTTAQAGTGAVFSLGRHGSGLFSQDAIQEHLLPNNVEYEVSNFHFSTIDANSAHADKEQREEAGSTDEENTPYFTRFELEEGDMLYLPTGWFHQVTSRQGRHTALNYWWRALNWRDAVEFERVQSEALYEQLLV